VAERAGDLIRQIFEAREVQIVRGAISPEHLHMLVVAPPQIAPAKLVQCIKGRSSRLLQQEFSHLRKRHWGQHPWAWGCFCATEP
jgi:putative transposase